MFRLWGKIWTDNHMMKDTVICNDTDDTRTHKILPVSRRDLLPLGSEQTDLAGQ